MPRAIWSGALSFGLVNVPVKLYSATGRKAVRFHQLNRQDGVRIQQRRVDPATGEEVSYDDIVKGYEIAPDQYVVVTPEELEALDPAATRTIDIEEFVELSQIDPVYFDSSYYLAPAAGGAKAYGLLLAAMRESGRVALAKMVLRSRQHLAAVRASGDVLTLSTMLYADEVVSPENLDEIPADGAQDSSEREVKMARQLIESLAADFDPARFHDEYREKVLQLIERKAAGEEIAIQPEAPPAAPVPDLMAALEASIAAARERTGQAGGRRRRRAGREDAGAQSGDGAGSAGAQQATEPDSAEPAAHGGAKAAASSGSRQGKGKSSGTSSAASKSSSARRSGTSGRAKSGSGTGSGRAKSGPGTGSGRAKSGPGAGSKSGPGVGSKSGSGAGSKSGSGAGSKSGSGTGSGRAKARTDAR